MSRGIISWAEMQGDALPLAVPAGTMTLTGTAPTVELSTICTKPETQRRPGGQGPIASRAPELQTQDREAQTQNARRSNVQNVARMRQGQRSSRYNVQAKVRVNSQRAVRR